MLSGRLLLREREGFEPSRDEVNFEERKIARGEWGSSE